MFYPTMHTAKIQMRKTKQTAENLKFYFIIQPEFVVISLHLIIIIMIT